MPREYYVYPNGNQIPIAGSCEYATQLPMSVSDATDVYTAINGKAPSKNMLINSDFICNTFDDTELNASGWIFSATSDTKPQLVGAMGLQIIPPCTGVEIATPIWYPAWSITQNVPSIDFPITVSVEYAYNTLSPETLRVASVTYPDNTQTSTVRNIAELDSGVYLQIKLTNTGTNMVSRSVFLISAQLTYPLYIRRIKIEKNSFATPFDQAMNDLSLLSVVKSSYVKKSGDTMSGQLQFSDNSSANIVVPARSMSYINKNGNAGIYAKKTLNSAQWYPVVCQDTKGGGHWQIGNYNSENLEFVYGTKTNRDNDTNTTQRFSLVPWNDNNSHDVEIITGKNIGTQSVSYASSAGSATTATTATGAGQLNSRGTASGTNHATALQAFFNANKASIPRNVGINIYSSAYSNGSTCFGYFLNGYDTGPYGGFFVAHYGTPRYVGIQGGSYSEQQIITSSTIGSQTVSKAGTATTATKGNTVANWSGGGTSGNLRFHAQISVLYISNGDSAALVNTSTLNTIFGVSNCSNANTAVFISNGDANACGAHVEGCNFLNNTWYACISYNTTCNIRVNWLAVYFG